MRKLWFINAFLILTIMFSGCDKKSSTGPDNDEPATVTDIDGNVYTTVKIGNQLWTVENLRVTHYRNGDPIPEETGSTNWKNLSTGARCAYNNNAASADTYGYLYNWFALNDSRNIAPEGWRAATQADWQTLGNSLGGTSTAGGKMKEAGTGHWQAPNTGATNESGFTALPGGCRDLNGNFYLLGRVAYFWTATAIDANGAWNRVLSYENAILNSVGPNKTNGFSVRLIRE